MSVLLIFRLGALSLTIFFAIGHLTSETGKLIGVAFEFGILGITSACLTLLTLPVIPLKRCIRIHGRGRTHLAWYSLGFVAGYWCGFGPEFSVNLSPGCAAYIPLEQYILGETTYLILTMTLLVFSVTGHIRGHKVWMSSASPRQNSLPLEVLPPMIGIYNLGSGSASTRPALYNHNGNPAIGSSIMPLRLQTTTHIPRSETDPILVWYFRGAVASAIPK